MKKIKRLFVIPLLLLPLIGCQAERGNSLIEKQTPHSIAINYLFIHGMCVGYLQKESVTKEQFQTLVQLDQQAKQSVIQALTTQSGASVGQAQSVMKQVVAFISTNQ